MAGSGVAGKARQRVGLGRRGQARKARQAW